MSDDARLKDLLSRWEEMQLEGRAATATELCAGCPELATKLQEQIDAIVSCPTVDGERPVLDECPAPSRDTVEYVTSHSYQARGTAPRPPHVDDRTVPIDENTIDHVSAASNGSATNRDGSPTATDASPATDIAVPGYEIQGELGRGGMGVVYKARQAKLGRTVALKMILAGGHANERVLGRFRTEAEAIARLQHPGIVQIHETGLHQGLPYFSLEFVEGGSLEHKLKGVPLPPNSAARLTVLLAKAMQAAHEQDILHRDLKPANVFLKPTKDNDGVLIEDRHGVAVRYLPKIGDFGLAKKLDGESSADHGDSATGLTATGAIMGTPSYMAPEQADGKGRPATPGADVYSLGAILYELLTGRPPFRSATPLETLKQVVHDEPISPRLLITKIPRDLDTICLKCLQKEPSKRYPRAQDLADDLERFLRGEPILARPVGRLERTIRWCRRNPAVAGLLAAVFVVLLLGTAVATYFAVRANLNADSARQQEQLAKEETSAKEDALQKVEQEAGEKDRALQRLQEALGQVKSEAGLKEIALGRARDALAESQVHLADANILLAQAAWKNDNVLLARELLDRVPTEPNQLRGFEWSYLKRHFDGGIFTLHGHTGWITSVAFNPDGTCMATGSLDRSVRLWDPRTGAVLREIRVPTGDVTAVAFSPDGTRLASGSADGVARLWDVHSGALAREFKGHAGTVFAVAFNPDGTRLATGSFDHTARLWDAQTGAPIREFKGHTQLVSSVAFSPDGSVLATASADKTARLWNVRTGVSLHELKGHNDVVNAVAFSPDGSLLATASADKTARLWDMRTGDMQRELAAHSETVDSVAFSPDGSRLATGGLDWMARVWEVRTGAALLQLEGHTNFVSSVAFSPDGTRLLTGSYDQTARLWDARTAAPVFELNGHANAVNRVAFSPDGTRVATASTDKTAQLWEVASGTKIHELKGHTGAVASVAFSLDGKLLATGSWDKTARVWDARTGALIREFNGNQREVDCVAFSPDGMRLATSGKENIVRLWDVQTGALVREFTGHVGAVPAVAFSPDGKLLASASIDLSARLWNAETGALVHELKGHSNLLLAVAFSANGKLLATGSGDHTARLWDVQTGTSIRQLKGHTREVFGVAFSPDGTRLATGGGDQTARLWDVRTGAALLEFKGHTNFVNTVAFSPDGTRLATGSEDHTVRLWDARPDAGPVELKGNANTLAFSPDSARLATAGSDATARLWDVRTGAILHQLKGHTERLTCISFSSDGMQLATGSNDNSARLWNARTGAAGAEFKHKRPVTSVRFSPDGTRLATGSFDARVRLWDVQSSTMLLELKGHTNPVSSTTFNADGTQLVSRSAAEVIVWDLKSGKPIQMPPPDEDENPARSPDGRWVAVADRGVVRLLDLQQQLDPLEIDYRTRATRFDRGWHEEQWTARRQAGDWFGAVYHIHQLLEGRPGDSDLLANRQAVVAEAVERDPKDSAALAAQMHLLLDAGKLDDYRQSCEALRKLAGDLKDEEQTRRLASACLMAPDALTDLQPVLAAYEKILTDKLPEDLRIHGGLLLRAGKAADAVKRLEAARQGEIETPQENLLLALAYHQLKKPDVAKKCLARAIADLDRIPLSSAVATALASLSLPPLHTLVAAQLSRLPDRREHALGWQGAIELQALRREAVKALSE